MKLVNAVRAKLRRPRNSVKTPPRRTPEDELTDIVNLAVGPDDLTKAPVVVLDSRAVSAVAGIADRDAQSPNMDMHSRKARPPSSEFVARTARTPLDRLYDRARAVIAEFESGAYGRVLPGMVKTRLATFALLFMLLILLAAAITEVVYGQTAAQILTGATPGEALLGALGFTLATNLLAWAAAWIVHRARPGLLPNAGVRIGAYALLLTVSVAITLGLVIGGYDAAQPVGGSGISGGGETTVDAGTSTAHRPLLAAAYIGILVVIICASFLAHLIHLEQVSATRTRAIKEAQKQAADETLDPDAQARVAGEVLRSHVAAIEVAHNAGARLVAEYNAAFARAVNNRDISWEPAVYDDTDPEWKSIVTEYIEHIEPRSASTASRPGLVIVA